MNVNVTSDPRSNPVRLEACRAYVRSQVERAAEARENEDAERSGPAVTISHLTGAGAHEIALILAGQLQARERGSGAEWTVFDRDLVDRMLEEHNLPNTLAQYMPEDRRPYLQDVMDDLFGVIPPSWEEVRLMAETVLHLADAGRVILVGRGASFITRRLPNVFHVRLIADFPTRVRRVQEQGGLTAREAEALVRKTDRARGRYVKSHFHAGLNDDLCYHLVVNTDLVPFPEAARLIAEGARMRFASLAR